MTSSELEAMVKNLNTRTTAIEQILPTLATKDDVRDAVRDLATKEYVREAVRDLATKADLRDGLAAVRSESRMLYEDLKGDIGLLAENLAHISQDLGNKIAQLARTIDERRR